MFNNKQCGRPPQYAPCKLTFDLLTLKVVSESHVPTTFVPILVFLGVSVLDLGPVYATDVRQTDRRQTHIIAYCFRPMDNKIIAPSLARNF